MGEATAVSLSGGRPSRGGQRGSSSTEGAGEGQEVGTGRAEQARQLCQQTLLEKTRGCVEEEAGPGAREAAGSSGEEGPGGPREEVWRQARPAFVRPAWTRSPSGSSLTLTPSAEGTRQVTGPWKLD